jgi:hypothetical protein
MFEIKIDLDPLRLREQAVRLAWARRQVRSVQVAALPPLTAVLAAGERRFTSLLPADSAALVPARTLGTGSETQAEAR